MINISEKELAELRKRSEILEALEAAGVENWEGYAYAVEEILEEIREQGRVNKRTAIGVTQGGNKRCQT